MKTLNFLKRNLLNLLLTVSVWVCGYYIGQERTFDKLMDCGVYGVFGISGGHYLNENFERIDSLEIGAFKVYMKLNYDGEKIEWDYNKEFVRFDACR